jgi:endonuclease-3
MAPSRRPSRRSPKLQARAEQLHARLLRAIPDPHVELRFSNPWELLVAVILSAQSTDRMVNRVMPELLRRWPTAQALATSEAAEVEDVIRPTGFFRNKTKSIRAASRDIVDRFGGRVPGSMEELLLLHGVARKTANVVLGTAFGVPSGITVDTHAMRVAQRLRLTRHTEPVKIEVDLCALFPREEWIRTGHRLVLHGRYVCLARAPRCAECPLNELCPSHEAPPEGEWSSRATRERLEMESRAGDFARPLEMLPAASHLPPR